MSENRHHGLAERAIQSIFQSGVIAKLLYASSDWWGFTSATDRMRIDAFIRRCSRSGYCAPNPHLSMNYARKPTGNYWVQF